MGSTTMDAAPASGVPIDPRIRARRIEVRRDQGRRRLQRLVDAGVVLAVAVGFVGALWTPLLDVDAVQVTGATRSGEDAVRDLAGIAPGDPLVGVDLRSTGRRLAALPWVAQVRLDRRLDGTVAIALTERTPVAVVGSGAQAFLVDEEGRLLAPVGTTRDVGPVVVLRGVVAPGKPGAYLGADASDALALAARLAALAPGLVLSVASDELDAVLAQGGVVRFGDARRLDAKVRSLQTVLDQVDLSCLALLDLRLPGSPVLTREEGCS